MYRKLHYFVIKKNTRTCSTSLWKAWGARHIYHMATIFYIENYFYCILLKKKSIFPISKFWRFISRNFKKSYWKKIRVLFFNIERDKRYFFRKKIVGCKLRMEWPIYKIFLRLWISILIRWCKFVFVGV